MFASKVLTPCKSLDQVPRQGNQFLRASVPANDMDFSKPPALDEPWDNQSAFQSLCRQREKSPTPALTLACHQRSTHAQQNIGRFHRFSYQNLGHWCSQRYGPPRLRGKSNNSRWTKSRPRYPEDLHRSSQNCTLWRKAMCSADQIVFPRLIPCVIQPMMPFLSLPLDGQVKNATLRRRR